MKRLLAMVMLLAGCSADINEYQHQQPTLDIFNYFQTPPWTIVRSGNVLFMNIRCLIPKAGALRHAEVRLMASSVAGSVVPIGTTVFMRMACAVRSMW